MPRTRIKLCGIMTPDDAVAAAAAGADAVGMILHADARRKIDADTAAGIVAAVGPFVTTVGVFVNAEPGRAAYVAGELALGVVQLHGSETPADAEAVMPFKVIKAIKCDPRTVRPILQEWRAAYGTGGLPNLAAILLEAPTATAGGTGEANDFALIETLQGEGAFDGLPSIIVAGGLRPENVAAVVHRLRPYAVDVSSGIEEIFGRKSPAMMRRFIEEASRNGGP